MRDDVDFLPDDKRQSFPQIDTVILGVCGQTCLNYTKFFIYFFIKISFQNFFAISLQYIKKEVSDEVDIIFLVIFLQ